VEAARERIRAAAPVGEGALVRGAPALAQAAARHRAALRTDLPLVLPLARAAHAAAARCRGHGSHGFVAAAELARGQLLAAALVLQVKTVLDNADGQLARLTGRVTDFGRYLDSELDLLVNAALFAALAWRTSAVTLPLLGFLALTGVLSVNFNADRLSRAEHDGLVPAALAGPGRGTGTAALRRVYALLYGWQDTLLGRAAEWRLRGRGLAERLSYHDRDTVSVLANLGLSTQLVAFGALTVLGRPLVFAWLALAELGLVAALAARRDLRGGRR
jgi:archaetidylinositol phosphate synthase